MKKLIFILMLGSLFADEIDSSLKLAQEGKFEEAKTMIMPLAIQENPEAQYWLSLFYSDPDALNQPLEGEKWLYKAAHNGNAMAQYRIGMNFSAGWLDSTIDSLVNAIYWFEKSGYNGNADAYANLGAMYDKENRNVLTEMEEAANYDNAMAQYNMGWIYARGLLTNEGLMQDIDIAKVWFEKSAALGFEDAKRILKKNFSEPAPEVNANIIKDINDLRKIAFKEESSLFDNMMELNDLKIKYYEEINWYNISEEEKSKVLNEQYPLGAIVLDNYSTESGLDILFIEARALSTSAQIFLNILYKYGYEEKIEPYNIMILNFWRELAKENLGRPNLFLGIYYVEGLGVEKNYKIAQKYLEESQIYSSIEESYYYLGYCYFFNDEIEKALNQWEEGLTLEHADCGYALGVYYRDNEKFNKSLEYFEKVLTLNNDDTATHMNIAQIYLEGWGVDVNPDKAIIHLDRIVELNGGDAGVFLNLGTAYMHKGNNELKIKNYQEAARLGQSIAQDILKKDGIEW